MDQETLKLSDLWDKFKKTQIWRKRGGKKPLATVYRLSNCTNMQKPIIVIHDTMPINRCSKKNQNSIEL